MSQCDDVAEETRQRFIDYQRTSGDLMKRIDELQTIERQLTAEVSDAKRANDLVERRLEQVCRFGQS